MSETEILREKYYVQFASHAAVRTDAPGVKFRPRETIFFSSPEAEVHKTRHWHAEGNRTVA
jgi:hypothetical protein